MPKEVPAKVRCGHQPGFSEFSKPFDMDCPLAPDHHSQSGHERRSSRSARPAR